MVSIFSWLKKKEDVDYERVLSELDDKIRDAELAFSALVIREQRHFHAFWFYGSAIYIVIIAFYFIYPTTYPSWGSFFYNNAPWMLFPFGAFLFRGVSLFVFKRAFKNLNQELEELRLTQTRKIEEMKKKTAYYMTKGLIERYESPRKSVGSVQNTPQPSPMHVRPSVSLPGPTALSSHSNGGSSLQQVMQGPLNASSLKGLSNAPQQNQPNLQTPLHAPQQNHTSLQNPLHAPQQNEAPQPHQGNTLENPFNAPLTSQPNPHLSGSIPDNIPVMTARQVKSPERTWLDRVLDAVVGQEDGPQHRYALICQSCFSHNGLALPQEFLSMSKFDFM